MDADYAERHGVALALLDMLVDRMSEDVDDRIVIDIPAHFAQRVREYLDSEKAASSVPWVDFPTTDLFASPAERLERYRAEAGP